MKGIYLSQGVLVQCRYTETQQALQIHELLGIAEISFAAIPNGLMRFPPLPFVVIQIPLISSICLIPKSTWIARKCIKNMLSKAAFIFVIGWSMLSVNVRQKTSRTTYAIRFNSSICTLLVTNSYT